MGDILGRPEEESPYPLDVKVGFIYSGNAQEGTLNAIFETARFEVRRTLGAETCYIDNVLVKQFEEAVETLVDAGVNVIVATSNRYASAVVLMSKKHPTVSFISFGGSERTGNMTSVQPLLYQAANVLGFISAFNTVSNEIGMVIDQNFFNAYGIANAFALGVRELPHAQIGLAVNWASSASYSDTRNAINDLVSNGCDIIFLYQSDSYGIKYCEELGVNVIAFAHNLPELAPENFLSGMYFNFNSLIIDEVRKYMYGNENGELFRRGLNHGTVGMITLNENLVKESTNVLANTLLDYILKDNSPVFGGEIRDMNGLLRVSKGSELRDNEILSINQWLVNNIGRETFFSTAMTEDDVIYSDMKIKQ